MKFTIKEKQNGELAVRTLSEKAKRGYNETEGIEVYEYEGDDGKMYAVKSIDGIREDMAIEELEEYLEGWVCNELISYFIADDNGTIYAHDIESRLAAELTLADILTKNPEYKELGLEILPNGEDD